MLLSVLIVCVCAVALRPVERGAGVDALNAPSISAPPTDRAEAPPTPEPEATEPEAEPEPVVARDDPAPAEVDDEPEPEPVESEPPATADEPEEPSPAPSVGLVLPALDESPASEPPAPPSPLVGPPSEVASAPGIEASSAAEARGIEEPPSPAPVEPLETPPAAAEPVDQPALGADSIVIPRNNAGFRAGSEKGTPGRAAVLDRGSRAGAESSRRVKPARPASRFWAPSR